MSFKIYIEDYDVTLITVIHDIEQAGGEFQIWPVADNRSIVEIDPSCFKNPQGFVDLHDAKRVGEDVVEYLEPMDDAEFQRRFPAENKGPSCPHCVP